ncbi:MAG: isoprenylcysteine carboxylmethyltransferase family protein [Succinivibrio sp.]|nr:isoprenylcysteine carboxylmethyltransferase family protein [Succinivibrio sp.]
MSGNFTDRLVASCGCIVFLLGGPLVMFYLAAFFPAGGDFLPPGLFPAVFGSFSSACGLLFIFWSIRELHVKGQGGIASFGRIHLTSKTKNLVTSGPYAVCRNPMHLGLVLFYLGISCAINSLYSLLFPLTVFLVASVAAVFIDEPRLKRDFGVEYDRWAAKVPRFWPRIIRN